MPAPWVTGADVLAHVRKTDPAADDTAWADTVADAVEGAIAERLGDGAYTPSSSQDDQLAAAALQDAAALYVARKAPHGILSIGPDGDVARLGAAILRACDPILTRISPGIG